MKRFLSGRISIWSISEAWGVVYYILFSLQITVVICLISWQEIFHNTDDTPTETLIAIGQGTAPLVITIAAETLVILLTLEGTVMLAERYLKRRYEIGREEGREEGLEEGLEKGHDAGLIKGRVEGFEEGREVGRIEVHEEAREVLMRQKRFSARLKAWDARRLKSVAEGKPFDEPMPNFEDDADDDESEEDA